MFEGQQIMVEAIVFAAVAAIGWFALRSPYDFLVLVRDGEVAFRGRFPPERRAAVSQFLANDVGIAGPYRVAGRWRAGRVLRLRFRGKLPQWEHRRIWNFFAVTLR